MGADMQAAEEPEHEKNDQYRVENAAESGSAIPAISVIATAAAEQQEAPK